MHITCSEAHQNTHTYRRHTEHTSLPNRETYTSWASPVAQLVKKTDTPPPTCQCRRHKSRGFDHWVGKIPWRGKWQPAPVFLPGKFHGQRSLAGYNPRSRKESDMKGDACMQGGWGTHKYILRHTSKTHTETHIQTCEKSHVQKHTWHTDSLLYTCVSHIPTDRHKEHSESHTRHLHRMDTHTCPYMYIQINRFSLSAKKGWLLK